MTYRERIEMKLDALALAEMLEDYQRIYMDGGDKDLRSMKEKEFDDRRQDFQIKYNRDFVEVVESVARSR